MKAHNLIRLQSPFGHSMVYSVTDASLLSYIQEWEIFSEYAYIENNRNYLRIITRPLPEPLRSAKMQT